MFWNHRIMQRIEGEGTEYEGPYLYIVEVFYHDDGSILGWTEKAAEACGENLDEVKNCLEGMMKALDQPVLIEADILQQMKEARENGDYQPLNPEDYVTVEIDELLDSLGLDREEIESWQDVGEDYDS